MTPPDVNLVEMRDAAVAGGHGDVFELDVHVVLGLQELSSVDDAGCDLEGDDVALRFIQKLDRNPDRTG